MTIGTGIAVAGAWIFATAMVLDPRSKMDAKWLSFTTAIGLTIAGMIYG